MNESELLYLKETFFPGGDFVALLYEKESNCRPRQHNSLGEFWSFFGVIMEKIRHDKFIGCFWNNGFVF